MAWAVRLYRDVYVDSVLQMSATRAMGAADGVDWAAAAMATPANLDTLAEHGFEGDELEGATAGDCFLAVAAVTDEQAQAAASAGEAALFGGGAGPREDHQAARPRSLEEAAAGLAGANLAVISTPGDYAALEAHKALSAGLHVLLFSDNVPVDSEIELKTRAEELGLLLMGPGAGTAMLGGSGLGFANALRPRPAGTAGVGIVAAAGTGAQEVMALLDRCGVPITAVIGVGGRDLSEAVGGRMARLGMAALRDDPDTEAILLVSKPPAEAVVRTVLAEAGGLPVVAALMGLTGPLDVPGGARVADTLEGGVSAVLERLGRPLPDWNDGLAPAVEAACAGMAPERRLVRGLFSGGTLCYEALVILSRELGPVHSNTPIQPGWDLPAPPGSHVCLDLGEEEYTRGRPHPMIDPEARLELLAVEGADPEVAVVLLDVVLGHGAHADPAGQLAPAVAALRPGAGGPAVVAYVLGTESDPQDLAAQQARLRDAGCIVPSTAAGAARAAAAVAARTPLPVERFGQPG